MNLERFQIVINLFLLASSFKDGMCLSNGLALTPPMGWLSWQRYRCNIDCTTYPDECISEKLYRKMGELLISEGYHAKGYQYIIIDDCWLAKERDKDGKLQADPDRFPNGIKSLADFMHQKGLKLGIYEDYGTETCAGYPGMIGNIAKDAKTFAEWEVDYVKIDGCNSDPACMDHGYIEFGRYLNYSGRPIAYSCSWPAYQEEEGIAPNYTSVMETCNLWRNYEDVQDSFHSIKSIIKHYGEKQDIYAKFAGPGHWNDPDMLIIGNFGLSFDQSKLQMAMWAILAAPLMMSVDLANVKKEFKEILQNEAIIAVNQDALGVQGRRIYKSCQPAFLPSINAGFLWNQLSANGIMRCQGTENSVEVWAKPITPVDGNYYSYALAFISFRTDGVPYAFSATLEDLGLYSPKGYLIQDLYEPNDIGFPVVGLETAINIKVNPSGVVFLRAKLQNVKCNKKNPNSHGNQNISYI
ncbi:alpha-N-acetylgalactosaminidase isoform X1 [Nilaparvata lugens]|uniref:alpha-N-acetylgalactosaminidase isoform X1 n=2 Tax=Nilaparvata lugens TaxID=108931 RepID=UPI00193E6324|nr:alpha-N-acetylgalactosaminidase isoform X1 [Nilaparvata lugens]